MKFVPNNPSRLDQLKPKQPDAPMQTPVRAVEWSCHAATTIKDASGKVLAECSGHGRYVEEDVAIAAEIVRRVNAHDELLAACQKAVEWLDGWASAEPYRSEIQAAISKATGGAA